MPNRPPPCCSASSPSSLERRPDLVLVVGDVNSTLACSLAAVKLGIPVAHVEAGLRSFDRTMPEEINRIVTDAIAELLFVTESSGVVNLRREGIDPARVHLVGNVMIDTLLAHRDAAARSDAVERLGLQAGGYAVLTLHRPANVDTPRSCAAFSRPWPSSRARCPSSFPSIRERARCSPATRAASGVGARDPSHRSARLSGFRAADERRAPRPHGQRGHPGRDDDPGRAVRDDSRKHRAPGHGHARHQSAGRHDARTGSGGRSKRFSPPISRHCRRPRCGTVARPRASSTRSRPGGADGEVGVARRGDRRRAHRVTLRGTRRDRRGGGVRPIGEAGRSLPAGVTPRPGRCSTARRSGPNAPRRCGAPDVHDSRRGTGCRHPKGAGPGSRRASHGGRAASSRSESSLRVPCGRLPRSPTSTPAARAPLGPVG